MLPFFGDDPDEPEKDNKNNLCDNCGTKLEWTLDLDGVQKRICPSCDN